MILSNRITLATLSCFSPSSTHGLTIEIRPSEDESNSIIARIQQTINRTLSEAETLFIQRAPAEDVRNELFSLNISVLFSGRVYIQISSPAYDNSLTFEIGQDDDETHPMLVRMQQTVDRVLLPATVYHIPTVDVSPYTSPRITELENSLTEPAAVVPESKNDAPQSQSSIPVEKPIEPTRATDTPSTTSSSSTTTTSSASSSAPTTSTTTSSTETLSDTTTTSSTSSSAPTTATTTSSTGTLSETASK